MNKKNVQLVLFRQHQQSLGDITWILCEQRVLRARDFLCHTPKIKLASSSRQRGRSKENIQVPFISHTHNTQVKEQK